MHHSFKLLAPAFAVLLASGVARASCAPTEPQSVQFKVDGCKSVDTSKIKESTGYAGLIVTGKDQATKAEINAWVSENEGRTCEKLRKRVVAGTLTQACCDGDPNPPCLLAMSARLKDVKTIGGATKAKKKP